MVQGSILGPIIFLLVINDIVVIGDINGTVVIYIYMPMTRVSTLVYLGIDLRVH